MDATNVRLAAALDELAALLAAHKVDRYRVRAYERAARTIRGLPVSVSSLTPESIRRLEGVGTALAAVIAEFVEQGTITRLEELRDKEPAGMGEILRLPLIGVRDARAIAGEHGVAGLAALRALLDGGGAEELLGERLAARARESIRRLDELDTGVPLVLARRAGASLVSALADLQGVSDIVEAGALRRGCETVDRLALVLEVVDIPGALEAVRQHPAVLETVGVDDTSCSVVTTAGWLADLHFATAPGRGAALLLATGAPRHLEELQRNVSSAGRSLQTGGIARDGRLSAAPSEERAFALLGLQVIPPELREGNGEVAAAASGALPTLVEPDDLLGDLHVHTDWSRDGKASLDDMLQAACDAGLRYVALTDHAENLTINGMPRDKVLARREAIRAARERYPQIAILDAAELNIGLDGSLDYDLEFLCTFDLTVASIHSHMDRPAAVQTERILAAIAHPAVDVIGHPTGRILGHRPPYGVEIEAIAQAAAETGTAVEVNGSPRRLDLSSAMVRAAVGAGAKIALSSDAHSTTELRNLGGAVTVARRGWATAADVINALPLAQLHQRVAGKRDREWSGSR